MEEGKKLSIAQCQKILKEHGGNYTNEQVQMIREVLYNLAELDYLIFKSILKSDDADLSSPDLKNTA
jgi:hypothetical protein